MRRRRRQALSLAAQGAGLLLLFPAICSVQYERPLESVVRLIKSLYCCVTKVYASSIGLAVASSLEAIARIC